MLAGVVWWLRPTHHTLSTPASAAGYQLLSGTQFDGVKESMQNQLAADDLKSTVVAVYGSGTTPYAVIVAARPRSHAGTVYQGIVSGFGSEATTPLSAVDPGHLGGQMMCGAITVQGQSTPTCAWGDGDTTGVILMIGGSSVTTAAQAVEFRDAVEH